MARVIKTSRKSRELRQRLPMVEVNVVSLMDILTVLLFFLIIMASFSNFSVVPAMGLPDGNSASSNQKPQFTLTMTMYRENIRLYLGPTAELKMQNPSSLSPWLARKWRGNAKLGFIRNLPYKNRKVPHDALQEIMVKIKKSFPAELKIVLAVTDGIPYQQVIDTVNAVRELDNKHEPFEAITPLGTREWSRILFPQVLITEWSEKEGTTGS